MSEQQETEGILDKVADAIGEDVRHLGHNFAENFPGLVDSVEHVVEEHPKLKETLHHLGHNFEENFPHLTGHVNEVVAEESADDKGGN